MERFNLNCSTHGEAINYYINRAAQILYLNIKLKRLIKEKYGVRAIFSHPDDESRDFQSFYLLAPFWGKGLLGDALSQYPAPVIVSPACGIVEYLNKFEFQYFMVSPFNSIEYSTIEDYYGDSRSNRSGVYYMNHIDEGIALAKNIFPGSPHTINAYCIHPIFQMDADLKTIEFFMPIKDISQEIIFYVMEYRNIANQYLSRRSISSLSEIALSPLPVVNDMLILDKVQNFKDFQIYHENSHPRSAELKKYFENWLEKLGVSKDTYQKAKEFITVNPDIVEG